MKLPLLAKVGIGLNLLAGIAFLANARWGALFILPCAAVYLTGAWGLFRGRRWGGFGPALFTLVMLGNSFLRSMGQSAGELAAISVVPLLFALLLFFAGRALATSGARDAWIVVCVGAQVLLTIFQLMVMPSGSMEETLLVGDRLVINRLATRVTRGSLVTHRFPPDRQQTFVKRVIGIPGDRIHFENKKLYVNGVAVDEPYVRHKTEYLDLYRDNFPRGEANVRLPAGATEMLAKHVEKGDVVVPAGKYFVLGDNRDNSLDSRYWGFIDQADILGKPVLVYYTAQGNTFRRL